MANGIARMGDIDHLGHVIVADCSLNVRINGQPVALKGSITDDGAAISYDVSTSVRANGRLVALQGSVTEYHERAPKGHGVIISASNNTKSN